MLGDDEAFIPAEIVKLCTGQDALTLRIAYEAYKIGKSSRPSVSPDPRVEKMRHRMQVGQLTWSREEVRYLLDRLKEGR